MKNTLAKQFFIYVCSLGLVAFSVPGFAVAEGMGSTSFRIDSDSVGGSAGDASTSTSYVSFGSAGAPVSGEGMSSPSFSLCEGPSCNLLAGSVTPPPPPPPPPGGGGGGGGPATQYTITNLVVDQVTDSGVRVSWRTDFLSDSFVEYGTDIGYGSAQGDSRMTFDHQVTLTNLNSQTLYHLRARSTDNYGTTIRSGDQTATTTLTDNTPPANVSSFSATPGDGQVGLSWTNSKDIDLAGVRIERSTVNFPSSPGTGTLLIEGIASSYTDRGLNNGTTYYYTAWSFDSSANHSSGAIASAVPKTPVVVQPPVVVPPPPNANVNKPVNRNVNKPVNRPVNQNTNQLVNKPANQNTNQPVNKPANQNTNQPVNKPANQNTNQPSGQGGETGTPLTPPSTSFVPDTAPKGSKELSLDYLLLNTNGVLNNISNHTVPAMAGGTLSVGLPMEYMDKPIGSAYLRVGETSYQLTQNSEGIWTADIQLPDEGGTLLGVIMIKYKNGTVGYVNWTIEVGVPGSVYEIVNDRRVPVEGAEVTLFANGQLWNGENYGQTNSQMTDADGVYRMFVPKGNYFAAVGKIGYVTATTAQAEINGTVSWDIKLTRIQPPKEPVIAAPTASGASGFLKILNEIMNDSPILAVLLYFFLFISIFPLLILLF